jgi:TonB-linked SusC/RagA family outer membrane protein
VGKRILIAAAAALFLAGSANTALAQGAREVTGKVTQASGAPLQDASVGVLGQAIGVRTNERGEYRLRIPAGDITLQARAIGFKRMVIRLAAGQVKADFALDKDVLQLEGVTVTGVASSIEKRIAATAVASVNSQQLSAVPSVSLENSLQGKVVGANISMNNGAPGGGGQVQIRGASSLIGRIDPLFVVDGVIISNAVRSNHLSTITGSLNSGEENGTNRLSDINSSDIENVEVLKGAAASAIYGSQATNGVIVITTKKGSMGQPKFNVTQHFGTFQLERKRGSRRFTPSTIGEVIGNSDMQAIANANCTATTCPYYDYQQQLYGRTDPSTETIVSLSGGANNTRYFVSAHDRQDAGIAINTGARRQSVRANLDQAVGQKITVNVGANVMRSFSQRGISNNDNSFASPIYGLGYTPAIANLNTMDASGHFPLNPFPAGYGGSANPFQTFNLLTNNEDVYRMIVNGRVNYSAYADNKNNINFAFTGGADRSSNEGYIVAPVELQFQRLGTNQGGQFPGTVIQGNGTNLLSNATFGGTWAYTGSGWNSTFQTGLQYEARGANDYTITGRGLGPQQLDAAGAASTSVSQGQSAVRNQAYYLQEEAQLLHERLYISGAIRGERSSVNGDRKKIYTFPRFAMSYRWANPIIPYTDEIKFRANYGQSGNQPNYGDRDVTLASYGLIGGLSGYGVPGSVGNPAIAPERLAEKEYGIDASMLKERIRVEVTYFNRDITNLLVRPVLAASTGISQTVVNGGVMESKGWEIGTTFSVIQKSNMSWISRVNWTQNQARITKFPAGVLPFTIGAAGGFGNAYGRLRFQPGFPASQIYGNYTDPVTKTVTPNYPIADANSTYLLTFNNEWTYKRMSVSALVDYRRGGHLSNMTLNIFDEGGNTWDYDKASPTAGTKLGAYRYNGWAGGANTLMYIYPGDFAKVREINVGYDLSQHWVSKIPGAKTARVSVAGRNLWIISGYNGFDPEVNNGGSQVARFVDLAPFPPSRNVAFTIDIGF